MSYFVYAIRLAENKFYIGSTYNLHATMKYIFDNQHKQEKWLNMYKPLYVDKIYTDCSEEDESYVLKMYINKYGENVWGKKYDSFMLEDYIKNNTAK